MLSFARPLLTDTPFVKQRQFLLVARSGFAIDAVAV
jgi:hypothetical protein